MYNINIHDQISIWARLVRYEREREKECVCVFFLAVYNKAQAQRISNREFKLWTILQGSEYRVSTFHAVCRL